MKLGAAFSQSAALHTHGLQFCILFFCKVASVNPVPAARDLNPFRFSGPLPPQEMIDRDPEADDLLALAEGRHSFRLVGPRRYGKTTLLRRVLETAGREGMATVLVDL